MVRKGAASFVKKTVFGVSDSLTKVTRSLGKGAVDVVIDNWKNNLTVPFSRTVRSHPRFRLSDQTSTKSAS